MLEGGAMAASVATLIVPTTEQMQQAVMSYVAQGFVVSTQTADTTTMFKKKEFNILWAVIGFFLCLLPLLIYCIVYATQKDQMVVVRIDASVPPTGAVPFLSSGAQVGAAEHLTWSEDRRYWWNGSTWIDAGKTLPPGVQFTEDGGQWWDGVSWRPRPATGEASASASNPPDGSGAASDTTATPVDPDYPEPSA
jgi:hypothetical protein